MAEVMVAIQHLGMNYCRADPVLSPVAAVVGVLVEIMELLEPMVVMVRQVQ